MLELSKHVESRPGHRDKPLAGAFGQASSVHLSLNELSLRIEQLQQEIFRSLLVAAGGKISQQGHIGLP